VSRWIRWKGLVPFLAVAALFAVFWLLLVDGYVERLIEDAGTRMVGARVELDGADLSLFPAGLVLSRLQVTNPDEPMRNAVEVGRVSFAMDGLQLLRRKVIVNEMAVEGVELDTPRKASGALKKAGEKEKPLEAVAAGLGIPSFKLPGVKELLEKEELETLKLARSLREDIEGERKRWKERLGKLPGREKIKEYKKRVDDLKSAGKGGAAGFLGAATEARDLKEDIEADLREIKGAQEEYKEALGSVRKRLNDARKAPGRDFNRLKEKYGISSEGISNATQALLGGKADLWVRKAFLWYGRLKPVLERAGERKKGPETVKPVRARGLDVHFKEHEPLPGFLVRLLNASVSIKAGDISGRVENITDEQGVTGMPVSFSFAGEDLKDLQSVRLDGKVNRVDPASPRDTVDFALKGYGLKDVTLSESEDFPVAVRKGKADLTVRAVLRGASIDAAASGRLGALELSAGREGEKDVLLKSVASVFEGTSGINIKAKVSGTLEDYTVKVSSDLDRALGNALKKQVGRQAAVWEKKLNAAIREKTGTELKGLKEGFKGLGGIDKELRGRAAGMDGLLGELAKAGAKGIKLPF
jgi:uncharacterized protein (TIGR03545 family)